MKRYGVIVLGLALFLAPPAAGQMTLADQPTEGSFYYYYMGGVNGSYGPYVIDVWTPGSGLRTPANAYSVDLYRSIFSGGLLQATAANLETGSLVAPFGFSGTAIQLRENLKKAAWLSTQFWSQPTSEWADIQRAIYMFTSGGVAFGDAAVWAAKAELMFMGYRGGDYSDWTLLTSDPGPYLGSTKSLLVQTTMTHSPEPQTYLLMATGLIFLFFVGRRRLKENGYV